jgi:hypothetical protein
VVALEERYEPEGDHIMTTLGKALIVLAALVVLHGPAHAKDQWVVAFGDEPSR